MQDAQDNKRHISEKLAGILEAIAPTSFTYISGLMMNLRSSILARYYAMRVNFWLKHGSHERKKFIRHMRAYSASDRTIYRRVKEELKRRR